MWLFTFDRFNFELVNKVFIGFAIGGIIDIKEGIVVYGEYNGVGKIAIYKDNAIRMYSTPKECVPLTFTSSTKFDTDQEFLYGSNGSGNLIRFNIKSFELFEKSLNAKIIEHDFSLNFGVFLNSRTIRIYERNLISGNLEKWKQIQISHFKDIETSVLHSLPHSTTEISTNDKSNNSPLNEINPKSLKIFCLKFGGFPPKYRKVAYNMILRLPENKETFENLKSLGISKINRSLIESIAGNNTFHNRIFKLATVFGNHCPLFSDGSAVIPYLIPFVTCFPKSQLFTFEVTLCFILNFTKPFWSHYPQPPSPFLTTLAKEFSRINGVGDWMRDKEIGFVKLIWPLLTSVCWEIMTEETWLKMMDFLICYFDKPAVYCLFVCNLVADFNEPIKRLKNTKEVYSFFKRKQAIRIDNVIKSTISSMKYSPFLDELGFPQFTQLLGGHYQTLDFFPEIAFSEQKRLRERLEKEERLEQEKENLSQNLHSLCNQLLKNKECLKVEHEISKEVQDFHFKKLIKEEEERVISAAQRSHEERFKRLQMLKSIETEMKGLMKCEKSGNLLEQVMDALESLEGKKRKEISNENKTRDAELDSLRSLSLVLAENLRIQKEAQEKERLQFQMLNARMLSTQPPLNSNSIEQSISRDTWKQNSVISGNKETLDYEDSSLFSPNNAYNGNDNIQRQISPLEPFESPISKSKNSQSRSAIESELESESFSNFKDPNFTPQTRQVESSDQSESNFSRFSSPEYLRTFSAKQTGDFSTLKNQLKNEISYLKGLGKVSENSSSFSSAAFD